MEHALELLRTQFASHDTQRFLTTRPGGFDFEPGQGVELAVDERGWKDRTRPFTPTCLEDDQILEFTIKRYPDRDGVTDKLHTLPSGARLSMSEPFGTIRYQGPGVFLAGGAGVTPFLAILRSLSEDGQLEGHSMIFSNKERKDVLCERELREALGERLHLTLTREDGEGYEHGRIDGAILEESLDQETLDDHDQSFYVCGPPPFVESLVETLDDLGVQDQQVVIEE